MRFSGVGVAVGLLVLSAGAAEGAIIVDDFSTTTRAPGNYGVTSYGGAAAYGGWDGPNTGVLGGSRQVMVSFDTPPVPGLDSIAAGAFPGTPGLFDYNSTAGAEGLVAVFYGSVPGLDPRPSLGLVIPDGSSATVDLVAFDLPAGGSLLVGVQVYGASDNYPAGVFLTTVGAQTVQVSLDDVPAHIRANVTGLAMYVAASAAVDLRVDSFGLSIPEPGATALLASAGLLAARRRRA